MFGKRKNHTDVVVIETPKSSILLSRMSSASSKEITVSEFEKTFFIALEEHILSASLSLDTFYAERMGNGSIRLNCHAGIIGTVHIRKRIGHIQYFLNPLDVHDMQDAPIEAITAVIPYWLDYAIGCLNLHKAATSV